MNRFTLSMIQLFQHYIFYAIAFIKTVTYSRPRLSILNNTTNSGSIQFWSICQRAKTFPNLSLNKVTIYPNTVGHIIQSTLISNSICSIFAPLNSLYCLRHKWRHNYYFHDADPSLTPPHFAPNGLDITMFLHYDLMWRHRRLVSPFLNSYIYLFLTRSCFGLLARTYTKGGVPKGALRIVVAFLRGNGL